MKPQVRPLNFITDVSPRATGDGRADNTAALQAALDAFSGNSITKLGHVLLL